MKGDLKMKVKSIFAVSLLVAGAAFADTTEVDTEYVLGVMPVNASGKKQVILSVPWVAEGSSANTAIAVTNLVKTSGLTAGTLEDEAGDTLTWYDTTAKKYKKWRAVSGDGGVAYWKPVSIADQSGLYAAPAEAQALLRGEAIVLTRSVATNPIYVVGQVGSDASVNTVVAASSLTLVAPPTVSGTVIDFNDSDAVKWGGDGDLGSVAVGDTIIADFVGGFTISYTNNVATGKWIPTYPSESQDAVIKVGRGFWYKREVNAPLTIQWSAPSIAN